MAGSRHWSQRNADAVHVPQSADGRLNDEEEVFGPIEADEMDADGRFSEEMDADGLLTEEVDAEEVADLLGAHLYAFEPGRLRILQRCEVFLAEAY